MSPFTTLLKTAKSKPQPYHVQVPTERIDELKQLVRLSKIGPETYENVHAITEEGGMGLTRAWLVRAREEWGGGWDWLVCFLFLLTCGGEVICVIAYYVVAN